MLSTRADFIGNESQPIYEKGDILKAAGIPDLIKELPPPAQ